MIKRPALEATELCNTQEAWIWEIKFAELIIQECNKLLSKNTVEQYTNAIKLDAYFFPHD